jgi:hypothetical protein
MPLGRYFIFVGGLLLAFFFLIDGYLPQTTAPSGGPVADRSIIRIHSAHKWPSAVVYDTSQPTMAPPAQPASAQAAVAPAPTATRLPRDALALAAGVPTTLAVHSAPPKHVKRRIRTTRTAPSERVAGYETFGFRPLFSTSW